MPATPARRDALNLKPGRLTRSIVLLFLLLIAGSSAHGQSHWVGTWACSQQLVEPQNSLPAADLQDATLRQIVHVSISGEQVRLKISNRFGRAPLRFTDVHLARSDGSATARINASTDKAVTFSGRPDVIIPAGADYVSDSLNFPIAALSNVAITLHIDAPPNEQTGHPGSRANSYVTHGNLVSQPDLPNAKTVTHWFFIAGLDVLAPNDAKAIATLGDSITDGAGSTTNANNRWPDLLARRLQQNPSTRSVAVLNQGIGGNRLLLDSNGPNALARFDADVLVQSGIRYLFILEGVNDLGMLTRLAEVPPAEHQAHVARIISSYEQVIARAHTHGIKVIGATILPFAGSAYYHPGPLSEDDRNRINSWIRGAGHFDAVVDFDQITRDADDPDRLNAAFDSGDHLHPSPAGFEAMADAIPLSLFAADSSAPKIAFTFDDLPAHSALPPGVTRSDVATKIVSALRAAQMPLVYGFTNSARVQEKPEDGNVLKIWRDAGYPLGNHSWSHMNLDQHTIAEFETEITANEPMLASSMKDADWHWFRYPYLAEGDTPQKRNAIRQFLAQRGYKVAAVTMSFADYLWNEPYDRCKAKGDTAAIAQLESTYLSAAEDSIRYYRAMSHTLYGRDIPYVLLMHIGAFDAEMLPRLLNLYQQAGFEFVTLQSVEQDPFYMNETDLRSTSGPDTLEHAMTERGLPLPPRAPSPNFDNLCR